MLFLDKNHDVIINRNELLSAARSLLKKMLICLHQECKFKLNGEKCREKNAQNIRRII